MRAQSPEVSGRLARERGFTLIELLIVVVIIGILAAIAIPKFGNSKEQAFVAQLRSDLKNLVADQEAYFDTNQTYYAGAVPNAALGFNASAGSVITLQNVTGSGWGASATHPQTARTCAIYFGTGGPVAPATAEGIVACSP